MPYLIALISGILMGLTTAPLEWWFLAWIALVPYWILLKSNKVNKLLIGFCWGSGFSGITFSWITGIHPMTWMGVPWIYSLLIALLVWGLITLWGTSLSIIWGLTFNRVMLYCLHRHLDKEFPILISIMRVIVGTAIWSGLESFWSASPLWWSGLSFTQSPHNLLILHLGQISGPITVSAAIVAVNGLIAESIDLIPQFKIKKGLLMIAIAVLTALHLIGLSLYHQPLLETNPPLKIGIIQGNIPNELKLNWIGYRQAIEGYTTGYKILADQKVDAILTPETALPYLWVKNNDTSLAQAIKDKGVVAWIGAFGTHPQGYTNSLFTISKQGTIFSQYDKYKLVPLGEYIPFKNLLGGLINRLSPLKTDLIPGSPDQIFDTPFGQATVGICYDSAYARHFRRQTQQGGKFILTASNNAHYSPAMPAQHHALDVMRAIENDRWMIRATNTGYSAVVDPKGRTIWISTLNTYQTHVDTIYPRDSKTIYVLWGDWLTTLLLFVSVLFVSLDYFHVQ